MSISKEPLVALTPPRADLLITDELKAAYHKASNPQLREIYTVPLFEELCNVWLRCANLSVYSQQAPDGSTQAVDLTVGFHDNKSESIFVLLLECKRHKVEDIGSLEAQLQNYGDRYLDKKFGGRAKYPNVYGATAFGTKIRFLMFSREPGHFTFETYSGLPSHPDERSYWDVRTDGVAIHGLLKKIWEFRMRMGKLREGQTLSSLGAAPTSTPARRALPSTQVLRSVATTLSAQGYQEVVFFDAYKQGEFYAYRLKGVAGAKAASEWTEQGGYFVHEQARLFGAKPGVST